MWETDNFTWSHLYLQVGAHYEYLEEMNWIKYPLSLTKGFVIENHLQGTFPPIFKGPTSGLLWKNRLLIDIIFID